MDSSDPLRTRSPVPATDFERVRLLCDSDRAEGRTGIRSWRGSRWRAGTPGSRLRELSRGCHDGSSSSLEGRQRLASRGSRPCRRLRGNRGSAPGTPPRRRRRRSRATPSTRESPRLFVRTGGGPWRLDYTPGAQARDRIGEERQSTRAVPSAKEIGSAAALRIGELVPISAVPKRPFAFDVVILVVYMLCVGLPIALSVSRSAPWSHHKPHPRQPHERIIPRDDRG